MNQALRLLENEHQELQAKIECLQGDRDLCSSDTQHLQGTFSSGTSGPVRPAEEAGWRLGFAQSSICCLVGFTIPSHLKGEAGLCQSSMTENWLCGTGAPWSISSFPAHPSGPDHSCSTSVACVQATFLIWKGKVSWKVSEQSAERGPNRGQIQHLIHPVC